MGAISNIWLEDEVTGCTGPDTSSRVALIYTSSLNVPIVIRSSQGELLSDSLPNASSLFCQPQPYVFVRPITLPPAAFPKESKCEI